MAWSFVKHSEKFTFNFKILFDISHCSATNIIIVAKHIIPHDLICIDIHTSTLQISVPSTDLRVEYSRGDIIA
jgi:hypothetical protein